MKFLDLFAGIGGFRRGFEQNGFKCIGHIEIDPYANISYNAIHDTTEDIVQYTDITEVTNEEFAKLKGKVDIIIGGIPCQAFSISGKRKGFEDARGTLFFDMARAIKEIEPEFTIIENVKGLLSHDKGNTLRTILRIIDELGYNAEWEIINSKNYGVPQNRERIYIVGYKKEKNYRIFPIQLETQVELETQGDIKELGKWSSFRSAQVLDSKGICPTINARDYKDPKRVLLQNKIEQIGFNHRPNRRNTSSFRVYNTKGISPTITTAGGGDTKPHVLVEKRTKPIKRAEIKGKDKLVRKVTPTEYWRLQGFKDEDIAKAKEQGISNTQLYKQAGNSVTVNVIDFIAKAIRREIERENNRG